MIVALTVSVSCDDDDDAGDITGDNALLGTWGYTESEEGEDYEYSAAVTFKSDATGTVVSTETYEGTTETYTDSFTWSSDGNELTIELDGEIETAAYSISGNKLTITWEYGTEVWTKQ